MKNKILEIKKALDAQAYLPALALSLTLPDICGQIEYPNLIVKLKNGKTRPDTKKRYIQWYDNYVKPLHFIPGDDQPPNQFDGKICYALRCAFLHSGNFDLKQQDENINIDIFKLHVEKYKGNYIQCDIYYTENGKKVVDLDIYNICFFIGKAVQEYYYNHKDKEDFEKYDPIIFNNSIT